MAMNISCKFKKASYNIFFVRAVTVKSLYTLRWRQRNEVKSIVSTGCYPVDTNSQFLIYLINYSLIYEAIPPKSNPIQAINPMNLHTKFQKDRLNSIP